jgi:hypothetical protein
MSRTHWCHSYTYIMKIVHDGIHMHGHANIKMLCNKTKMFWLVHRWKSRSFGYLSKIIILKTAAIFDWWCCCGAMLLKATIPSLLILIINSVLYIFIWRKINVESKRIQGTLGRAAASTRATHQAAKTMMLFIVMFIIQWTPSAVFGVWWDLNSHHWCTAAPIASPYVQRPRPLDHIRYVYIQYIYTYITQ